MRADHGASRLISTIVLFAITLSIGLSAAANLPVSALSSNISPTPAAVATAQPDRTTYPGALSVDNSASSAVVIESSRGRRLYDKNTGSRIVLPAANKIMTALIAAEKLSLDAKVTISKVAAAAGANETTDDRITLKTGDKYTVEYLLLRMLFYDSDAAAIALAEQVSNEESEFVKLMNARAGTYSLNNTLFANASGESILRNGSDSGDAARNTNVLASAQYSTVADLATLVQMAMMNEKFNRLFKKQSEYLVLDGKTLVPMSNRISRLWPFAEGRVSGAFLSGSSAATCITTGTVNGFNIITVTAEGDSGQVISDVLALYDACQRTYENWPLVVSGEMYTGAQETTRDGETFGLVYQKTVYYVRPIGDPFLMPTIRYNSLGPYSRPIQRTMTVGQVVFELVDGTRISVDVSPDRQILSSISLVDRTLASLQSNRNLFYLLSILFGLLALMIAGRAVLLATRLLHGKAGKSGARTPKSRL